MAQLPLMRLRGHVSHLLMYIFWSTLIACTKLTFILYYYIFILHYLLFYDPHFWLEGNFLFTSVCNGLLLEGHWDTVSFEQVQGSGIVALASRGLI